MRNVHKIGLLLLLLSVCLPGRLAQADAAPARDPQQDERVGETLERARDALRSAVEALAEAGQLTLDKQLPKLKEQTDQTLKSTQKLLNQWEEQLLRELEKRQGKKKYDHSPSPFDEEKGARESLPSI
ncbi:MAG: hypothetical protein H7838_03815 [Magnetococcus sp. DMHC-8]